MSTPEVFVSGTEAGRRRSVGVSGLMGLQELGQDRELVAGGWRGGRHDFRWSWGVESLITTTEDRACPLMALRRAGSSSTRKTPSSSKAHPDSLSAALSMARAATHGDILMDISQRGRFRRRAPCRRWRWL